MVTKLPRGKWVPLNQLIQHGQVITSDPRLKDFAIQNLQVAELWARAMNPTGVMREGDRDLALQYLSAADSPQTYAVAVRDIMDFARREGAVAKSLSNQLSTGSEDEQQPASAPAPGGGAGGAGEMHYDAQGNRIQ